MAEYGSPFVFTFSGRAELTVEDVWPDGDAPENPTALDVVERIQAKWSTVPSFLRDWNLDGEVEVYVDSERGL